MSFCSDDEALAKPIYERLRASGQNVFLSSESLTNSVGKSFVTVVEEALEQSEHFLLVCTNSAMKSKWVKLERECFFNQFHIPNEDERRMIMFCPNGFDPNNLPLFLRQMQVTSSVKEVLLNISDDLEEEDYAVDFEEAEDDYSYTDDVDFDAEEEEAAALLIRQDIITQLVFLTLMQQYEIDLSDDDDAILQVVEACQIATPEVTSKGEATVEIPDLLYDSEADELLTYQQEIHLAEINTVELVFYTIAEHYETETEFAYNAFEDHYVDMIAAAFEATMILEEHEDTVVTLEDLDFAGHGRRDLHLTITRDELWQH